MPKWLISTQIPRSDKVLTVMTHYARSTKILSSNSLCCRLLQKPWKTRNNLWWSQPSSRQMTCIALAHQRHMTTPPLRKAEGSSAWFKWKKSWSSLLMPTFIRHQSTIRGHVAPSKLWYVSNAIKPQKRCRTCWITSVAMSHLSPTNARNAAVGSHNRVTETVMWEAVNAKPTEKESVYDNISKYKWHFSLIEHLW